MNINTNTKGHAMTAGTIAGYTAEHCIYYNLNTPITHRRDHIRNGHEIDRILIEVQWCDGYEESDGTLAPAGWVVYIKPQGWPLTAKGKRNQRTHSRETIYRGYGENGTLWPGDLRAAAADAWTAILDRTRIDTTDIVNADDDLAEFGITTGKDN